MSDIKIEYPSDQSYYAWCHNALAMSRVLRTLFQAEVMKALSWSCMLLIMTHHLDLKFLGVKVEF